MALSIITTWPMVTYPCRFSLDNLLFPSKEIAPHRYLQFLVDRPRLRSLVETIVIIAAAYGLSIGLPSVTFVFSLSGSTSSTVTSFVFPCLFYLKLEDWRYWWEPKVYLPFFFFNSYPSWLIDRPSNKVLGALVLLVAGTVFGILATVVTITALFVDF